jgi:putative acetyltransferase
MPGDEDVSVILIGGVGYAGKTFMAQKLLEKYKYPYLSMDHLKMGLYRADMGCGFTPEDSSRHIGEILWPILKGIIMTNIENGQNIIIEGCYLLPDKVAELAPEYLKEVVSFYMGFSEAYIQKYLESKIIRNRNVIERRDYEDSGTVLEIVNESREQRDICEKHGAVYFEINEDYVKETDAILEWLEGYFSTKAERDYVW